MPSCNTYRLTWVSLTLDVGYLFMAAPAKCREIEENNRLGKTRDLFKIIRDTKGIFHAKMGTIKDKSNMDLTEAEDIKKWQEYWRGLPYPSPEDLPDPGIEPSSPESLLHWR